MSLYDKDLNKNQANFVPLTPLTFLKRAKDIYPNYEAIILGQMFTKDVSSLQVAFKNWV